jgi:hypothetical protein
MEVAMHIATARLRRVLPKIAFLLIAAGALSGCVVVPLYPYHPHYAYWYR